MSEFATRDSIIGKPFKRSVVVEDYCGAKYRIRNLTAGESNAITSQHLVADDEQRQAELLASLPARYILMQWVDENGDRVLGDDDLPKLLAQGASFVSGLAAICQSHNGKGDVAAAEKNSAETQS